MTAHHPLGASNAHRWRNCPASVKMERGLPDSSSPAAMEGTLAHWVLEQCLLTGKEPEEYVGDSIAEAPGFTVTSEMARYIEGVIGRVQIDASADDGSILWSEATVDYGPWAVDGAFGTADVIIYFPKHKTLLIKDLKYGLGETVYASHNDQLRLYGLGAYHLLSPIYEIEEVRTAIDQPRKDHYDCANYRIEELLEWGEETRKRAALCFEDDPEFNPGDHTCKWCKARSTCKAFAEYTLEGVIDDFDNLEIVDKDLLSDEDAAAILSRRSAIENFLKALADRAFTRLEAGEEFPDFKLVRGRSNRRWRDETEAEAALRKRLKVGDVFNKKLISPKQAEDKLGKAKAEKVLADLIVKDPGKPTLAHKSDKREAISSIADDFDNLENQ